METITISVAEAKKKFSEYISRSGYADCRVIITKRNRPLAAIIGMKDLHRLEQGEKRGGLLKTVGKWDRFDELKPDVDEAVEARHLEELDRDVSL